MEPRLSFVTLGVSDLERATRFYERGLGLADAAVSPSGSGFAGFALAHNVRSEAEADRLLQDAAAAGGRIVKPGRPTDWGGYAGYFADPDGFFWEVAWNPRFPHL